MNFRGGLQQQAALRETPLTQYTCQPMNSRRLLQIMLIPAMILALAAVGLFTASHVDHGEDQKMADDLAAEIRKQDAILAEKRRELDALKEQVRLQEEKEARAHAAILEGEQAFARKDWEAAEKSFLSALADAPRVEAALEGWIKVQVRKAATPETVEVKSCEFSASPDRNSGEVTIKADISGPATNTDFQKQLSKIFECANEKQESLPHSALKQHVHVRFKSPEVIGTKTTDDSPPRVEYSIKIAYSIAKVPAGERTDSNVR